MKINPIYDIHNWLYLRNMNNKVTSVLILLFVDTCKNGKGNCGKDCKCGDNCKCSEKGE